MGAVNLRERVEIESEDVDPIGIFQRIGDVAEPLEHLFGGGLAGPLLRNLAARRIFARLLVSGRIFLLLLFLLFRLLDRAVEKPIIEDIVFEPLLPEFLQRGVIRGARQLAPVGDIDLVGGEVERLLQPFLRERAELPVAFPVEVVHFEREPGIAAPERRSKGAAERHEPLHILLREKHPVGIERVEILVEQPFGKRFIKRLLAVVTGGEELRGHLRDQSELAVPVPVGIPAGGGGADFRGGQLRRPKKKCRDRTGDPDGEQQDSCSEFSIHNRNDPYLNP